MVAVPFMVTAILPLQLIRKRGWVTRLIASNSAWSLAVGRFWAGCHQPKGFALIFIEGTIRIPDMCFSFQSIEKNSLSK
jgi:hypothetical protein